VTDFGTNQRIQKFDGNGNFIAKWGSLGSAENQFEYPYDLAVDTSGNVFVADTDNHRVQMFDNTGAFVRMWGWGVDTGFNGLEVCTSSCRAGISGSTGGQFDYPKGVAVDAAGNIYVASTSAHQILVFDRFGTFRFMWGSDGTGDGQFKSPYGVAVDLQDNVYVSDSTNSRIQKFDDSGAFLTKWGTPGSGLGQLLWPRGMAVDDRGRIYVADSGHDRIQVFGPALTSFRGEPDRQDGH
jgi:DNA-binding beta-propeller fold protein YncE